MGRTTSTVAVTMSRTTGNIDPPIRHTRSQSQVSRNLPETSGPCLNLDEFLSEENPESHLSKNYIAASGFSPSFRSVKRLTLSPVPSAAKLNVSGSSDTDTDLNVTSWSDKDNGTNIISSTQIKKPTVALASFDNFDNFDSLCTSFNDLAIGAGAGHATQGGEQPALSTTSPVTPITNSFVSNSSLVIVNTQSYAPPNDSPLDPPLSREQKIDKILFLIENNSAEISSLKEEFSSLKTSLHLNNQECWDKIEITENRLRSEIHNIDVKCDDKFSRVNQSLDHQVEALSAQVSDVKSALEAKILTGLNELETDLRSKLSSLETASHSKSETTEELTHNSVKLHVEKFLGSKEGAVAISHIMNNLLETKELDLSEKSPLSQRVNQISLQNDKILRDDLSGMMDKLKTAQHNFEEEIKSLKASTVLNGQESFTQVSSPSKDLKVINKRIEKLSLWIESLQQQLAVKAKLLSSLDLKSRKANLIFDGVSEAPNEDLFITIGSLLANFVSGFDIRSIENVFRLGRFNSSDRNPRRILVVFISLGIRDSVLNAAGHIAKAGPPGGKIYVNEDLPDEIKRRRADVYKYVQYMLEKGYNISQRGDSVQINKTVYKYEELSAMPPGMTLADSRTIEKKGVIAFQSPHSPLSNLYPCTIKRNGLNYKSAEHAFQHSKAVVCKDFVHAKAILIEPSPFDVMAIGKAIDVTSEWSACQLDEMACILRLKMDQVPVFSTLLKSTDRCHLVENSRSTFWGAGTPYNSELIFRRNYPGQNRLGKLLEQVRDLL